MKRRSWLKVTLNEDNNNPTVCSKYCGITSHVSELICMEFANASTRKVGTIVHDNLVRPNFKTTIFRQMLTKMNTT